MPALTAERQKTAVLAVGLAAVGAVAALDYFTGIRFSLAVINLAPLYFVTLRAGKGCGFILALVGIAFQAVATHLAGRSQLAPAEALWRLASWGGAYFLVVTLTARMQRALSRTRALSLTDFLTGALNSRAFDNLLENEHRKTMRFGRPMTLAYIGIDNFQTVNSRFGHTVGDRLLRKAARTMMRNLRVTDRVARLGGDEFIVLLPETDQGAARVAVTKIGDRLADLVLDHHWPVTFSVGAVTFFTVPQTPREMIQLAEQLMRAVKAEGKNATRYAVYND